MRTRIVVALALLALVAAPSAALAAKPSPWPSAHDIQTAEPGVSAKDAACLARFYRGRLSRKLWFTQYYALTPAQKLLTDAGGNHCMTRAERIASGARTFEAYLGKHAELTCVGRGVADETRAQRLAMTTRAKEALELGRIFRSCGLTGALYAVAARQTKLVLRPGEQACANRVGPLDPALHATQGKISSADLKTIGVVFDRCVGTASEEAMYRRVLQDRKFKPASAIACVAHREAGLTFVALLTQDPGVKTFVTHAVTACVLLGGAGP